MENHALSVTAEYEAPHLQVHGSIVQATQAAILGPEADQMIPAGQPIVGRLSF